MAMFHGFVAVYHKEFDNHPHFQYMGKSPRACVRGNTSSNVCQSSISRVVMVVAGMEELNKNNFMGSFTSSYQFYSFKKTQMKQSQEVINVLVVHTIYMSLFWELLYFKPKKTNPKQRHVNYMIVTY